jgi:hypothetical protein
MEVPRARERVRDPTRGSFALGLMLSLSRFATNTAAATVRAGVCRQGQRQRQEDRRYSPHAVEEYPRSVRRTRPSRVVSGDTR